MVGDALGGIMVEPDFSVAQVEEHLDRLRKFAAQLTVVTSTNVQSLLSDVEKVERQVEWTGAGGVDKRLLRRSLKRLSTTVTGLNNGLVDVWEAFDEARLVEAGWCDELTACLVVAEGDK